MPLKSALTLYLFLAMLLGSSAVQSETLQEPDFDRIFAGYRGCLVLKNLNNETYIRYNTPQGAKRLSPCSTFKILNSLIGLETGVISAADHPMHWDGQKRFLEVWNQDHTLRSALANSVVWYYQEVALGVGQERMRHYLQKVQYGNEDLSGGLSRFWLSSSLLISANEQVAFLERLYREQLPFSQRSLAIVKDILIVASGPGWILRGKTGSARFEPDARDNLGWFVGYLTKGEQVSVFAVNIEAEQGAGGRQAKEITMAILKRLQLL